MTNVYYTNVNIIGDNILFRGIREGKRIRQKIKYKPKFWVSGRGDSEWRTLDGFQVQEMKFPSIRDAREFIRQYESVDNFTIYGTTNYEHAFISDVFPQDIDWKIEDVCLAFIDIEVDSSNGFPDPNRASEDITAISMSLNGRMYVFGCGEYETKEENVEYIKCSNEVDLLKKFINVWTQYYPDVISGWNTKFFDIPYLINRIVRVFGSDSKEATSLSPWGKIKSREIVFQNKKQIAFEILGVSSLDYYELYRKYSSNPNQESFKLDHIANVELNEKKLDYSEYSSLHELHRLDYEKFIDYNIKDTRLVERLESKLKLIELALTLAYDAKVNYTDVFSQVRMWDTIIYNALKKKKIVVPPRHNSIKTEQYAGAYVKDPQVGMHEWVASFDLNSLYPSLIQQYNMSPETLISSYDEKMYNILSQRIDVDSLLDRKVDTNSLSEMGLCLTANKQLFSTEKKGFLADLMETFYEDRLVYKKKSLESKKKLQLIEKEMRKRNLLV
jgi:DNA polymerase elongation subunit (family B)